MNFVDKVLQDLSKSIKYTHMLLNGEEVTTQQYEELQELQGRGLGTRTNMVSSFFGSPGSSYWADQIKNDSKFNEEEREFLLEVHKVIHDNIVYNTYTRVVMLDKLNDVVNQYGDKHSELAQAVIIPAYTHSNGLALGFQTIINISSAPITHFDFEGFMHKEGLPYDQALPTQVIKNAVEMLNPELIKQKVDDDCMDEDEETQLINYLSRADLTHNVAQIFEFLFLLEHKYIAEGN